jgi:hypothetical protein
MMLYILLAFEYNQLAMGKKKRGSRREVRK